MPPSDAVKSWKFTIYWEDEEELEDNRRLLERLECTRLRSSIEICPSTQREHIQGAITFPRTFRLKGVKTLHPKAHWEPAKTEDFNYEVKFPSRTFVDKLSSRQGARQDIDDARAIVKETCSMRAVVEATSSYQAIRMCEKYLAYSEPKRPVGPIQVHWYWGPTGVGKTRAVWDREATLDSQPYVPPTDKFWEGYDGDAAVLLDDFRPEWCSWKRLLQLTDIYPFRVEVKGGSRQARYTRLYITAPEPPDTMMQRVTSEDVNQLLRRITEIKEFSRA